MPIFVKTGNWESKSKGAKGELDLNRLIEVASPKINLMAGANVLITGTYPNLTISSSGGGGGGSVWGLITGTITDQTDLVSYIAGLYTPLTRSLTINGVAHDLSADRSWSVGTVTNFSSGDLSPLFTTNVATSTSTPALSFTLSNVAARKWFGNNTSGSTTPSFNSAGSLTETNSSVLTITGSNSLLNDTTIEVGQSTTSTSGYLSSTDWNTFNTKLSPALSDGNIFIGNSLNVATSKTMSGDATILDTGVLTLATVNSNVGTFVATTVNGKGLVTAAAPLSGDITTSGAVATLSTVNSNVGTFGSATKSVTVTANGKGLITAISEQTVTPAVGSITGLGTGIATFLAIPSSANLASAVTDETGTGSLVFSNSPTLVTPALGTPSSVTLTNAIGLPISSGVTGLGTGVITALGINVGSSGAFIVNGGSILSATTAVTQSPLDSSTKIATTAYTDAAITAAIAGLDIKPDVAYVSLSPLPANTYNNGSSGVGATLTGNSNGPLVIDGVTLVIGQAGQRVLIAGESASANNGWYTITQVGVALVSPYILTRATESDQASEIGAGYLTGVVAPNTVVPGTNNGKLYISVAADPFVVGTTALTFSQVGSTYSAGTGLDLSGNTFSVKTSQNITTLSNLTTNGGIVYSNGSGVLAQTGVGSSTQVLHGGTLPSYSAVSLTADVTGTLPVANGGTGITSFGSGIATFLGMPSSANLASALTDELGSGQVMFNTIAASTITDASTMDIANAKNTLTTSSATRTFTISYAGDDITLEITLNNTSSALTFPATSLCISDGVASGNNVLTLTGTSGDRYIVTVKKIGSNYYVASKNWNR